MQVIKKAVSRDESTIYRVVLADLAGKVEVTALNEKAADQIVSALQQGGLFVNVQQPVKVRLA